MQGRKVGLTATEKEFVAAMTQAVTPTVAAERAGLSQPARDGWRMMQRPQVVDAIINEQRRRLAEHGLPATVDWFVECVSNDKYKPSDRNTAGKTILQYTIGSGEAGRDKAPEDMTPDELQARIAILRARQAQLADGAKLIDGDATEIDAAPQQDGIFD